MTHIQFVLFFLFVCLLVDIFGVFWFFFFGFFGLFTMISAGGTMVNKTVLSPTEVVSLMRRQELTGTSDIG